MFSFKSLTALVAISSALAHPLHFHREVEVARHVQTAKREIPAEVQVLLQGNERFRTKIAEKSPTLLKTLVDDGQST